MPKFEQNVILYGLTPFNRNNALQNHILLLFKQFVYMCRKLKCYHCINLKSISIKYKK